jgi:hypothetical protein
MKTAALLHWIVVREYNAASHIVTRRVPHANSIGLLRT